MVEVNCDTKILKGIAKMTEKYKDNLTKKKVSSKVTLTSYQNVQEKTTKIPYI